jgi:hypothetical protein
MLLEGYLKIITLRGFFWDFENNLLFWIFSADSACVGKFLAQAQPA